MRKKGVMLRWIVKILIKWNLGRKSQREPFKWMRRRVRKRVPICLKDARYIACISNLLFPCHVAVLSGYH
jgi:hypothetical protein